MLLVSPDPRVSTQVTTALLDRPDLEVTEVATPQRGLAQIDEAGPFDVIVADNDTHPTGGYYLAREVAARRLMGRSVPPVILLLARHQDAWLSDWAQADAWALKPVDPFDLAEVLDAVVEGRPPPALPGVGGDPKPGVLDIAADRRAIGGAEAGDEPSAQAHG